MKGLIPEGFEINHKNEAKTDNRIKNFEILTHKENIEKSLNKLILSINLQTSEKKLFVSIKTAAIKLEICAPNISSFCKKENTLNQQPLKTMEINTHLSM